MKKIVAAVFILGTGYCSFAQTHIAVKAGVTYSTAKVKDTATNPLKSGYKPGISLGIQFKSPFEGVLHFSPSIVYNMRSFKTTYASKVVENTIHYLDLIPALSVDFPAANENSFVITAGPVFGFTNFGSEKTTQGGTSIKQKMKFGFGATSWVDLGVTGSIGFHTKKVFAEALYFHGLANINNDEELHPSLSIQNRMFSLNIGYYFK